VELDYLRLVLILSGTVLLGSVAWLAARGRVQRFILLGTLVGLTFYSGIGAAAPGVAPAFTAYFFFLFAAIIVGFHLGRPLFLPVSERMGRRLGPSLGSMEPARLWYGVIGLYIVVSALPLLWPEWRLHELLAPPRPDLRYVFDLRFSGEPDTLTRLIANLQVVATPFFYLALYRLRHRLAWVAGVFVVLLYVSYVAAASISRGEVLRHLGFVILAAWFLRPRHRPGITAATLASLPLLVMVAYWYGRVRIGGAVEAITAGEALTALLSTEWGFPRDVGMPLIESGAGVDLGRYLLWIVTLPIPKLITGPIAGARINYEISEIVLGLPAGSAGWYVVLPGLVAESVYLFGPWLFWLHGLFIGLLAAFFARLAEQVPQFLFLFLYVAVMFAFVLNRGGIAGLLPPLVNGFLLFYVFLLLMVMIHHRQERSGAHQAPVARPSGG
jgi:hypothetical protein